MKIKYQFATETVEIEVADDWGNLVIDLDRQEYNNDHKETRRHMSLDAAMYEGDVFAVEDVSLESFADNYDLHQAIAKLTDNQRRIIVGHYFEGVSYVALAAELGISEAAVRQAANRALKQIQKNICPPVRFGSLPWPNYEGQHKTSLRKG